MKVPKDAFVCEVGGTEWQPIDTIPTFAAAFKSREPMQSLSDFDEQTIVDSMGLLDELTDDEHPTLRPPKLDATEDDHTVVDPIVPLKRRS